MIIDTVCYFHYNHFSYFNNEELKLLVSIIREEKLYSRKNQPKTANCEPITPIDVSLFDLNIKKKDYNSLNETYKIDFDTFRVLFNELTPWGKCQNVDLAEKLFRVCVLAYL